MKKRHIQASLVILFILVSPGFFKPDGKDQVNWIKGSIMTFSISSVEVSAFNPVSPDSGGQISLNRARLDAYNRAREQSIEKLISLLKNTRVDSNSTVLDYLKSKDITRSRLTEIINKKARLREYPAGYFSSGCRAELYFRDLIHVFGFKFPSDDFPIILDNPIPTEYTGLIIDARGLKIVPMIFPSVLNEDGLEIYSRHFIDIKSAADNGIVSYAYSESDAMKSRQAGERPFYTVSIRELNGCPVISNKDSKKILSSSRTVKHLKECRVIFIIDRNNKGTGY